MPTMNNMNMEEKDILNDVLNQEKQIVTLYSTAITESSCPNMRQMLMQNMGQISSDQYNVFVQMRNKGYYQVKQADAQEVQQAKQKFQQMKSQL